MVYAIDMDWTLTVHLLLLALEMDYMGCTTDQ